MRPWRIILVPIHHFIEEHWTERWRSVTRIRIPILPRTWAFWYWVWGSAVLLIPRWPQGSGIWVVVLWVPHTKLTYCRVLPDMILNSGKKGGILSSPLLYFRVPSGCIVTHIIIFCHCCVNTLYKACGFSMWSSQSYIELFRWGRNRLSGTRYLCINFDGHFVKDQLY